MTDPLFTLLTEYFFTQLVEKAETIKPKPNEQCTSESRDNIPDGRTDQGIGIENL